MAEHRRPFDNTPRGAVALVDACVTEWRTLRRVVGRKGGTVALVDACVTEWRDSDPVAGTVGIALHSLMLVLLNGG